MLKNMTPYQGKVRVSRSQGGRKRSKRWHKIGHVYGYGPLENFYFQRHNAARTRDAGHAQAVPRDATSRDTHLAKIWPCVSPSENNVHVPKRCVRVTLHHVYLLFVKRKPRTGHRHRVLRTRDARHIWARHVSFTSLGLVF